MATIAVDNFGRLPLVIFRLFYGFAYATQTLLLISNNNCKPQQRQQQQKHELSNKNTNSNKATSLSPLVSSIGRDDPSCQTAFLCLLLASLLYNLSTRSLYQLVRIDGQPSSVHHRHRLSDYEITEQPQKQMRRLIRIMRHDNKQRPI